MALYHLTAKTGTRASGQSALAKAQYLQREGRYARVPDRVVYTAAANLPSFAGGRATTYFEAADHFERANGRLYKEVEFALPVELEPDEQRELAERFARELLAGEALPYALAIHEGKGRNPHCHVLVSERVNDGVERDAALWFRRFNARDPELGGARKTKALKPREWLTTIREKWASLVNQALARAGFLERVDHRTLSAQGIERVPQIHLGPNVVRMESRGLGTDRGDQAERIEKSNAEIADRRATRARLERAEREATPGRDGANRRIHRAEIGEERALDSELPTLSGGSPGDRDLTVTEPPSRAERSVEPASSDRSEPYGVEPSKSRAGSRDRDASDAPDWATKQGQPDLTDASNREGATRGAGQDDPSDPSAPNLGAEPLDPSDREARELEREPSESGGIEASREADRARGLAQNDGTPSMLAPGVTAVVRAVDRTELAVSRQLRAMGCDRFEIGIRDVATGRLMQKTASAPEVLQQLPWLKRMNAQGNDIYVRPAKGDARGGLVVLDDLRRGALRALERDGRAPAAVVETSPGSYQAWIRVAREASREVMGRISRRLTREYGADPAAVGEQRFGRLAGFTNQKVEHQRADGLQPFALLRGASGRVAPEGAALLREATRALVRAAPRPEQDRAPERREPREPVRSGEGSRQEATELYRREFEKIASRTRDLSRCDFGAALRLAERGFDRDAITQAIRTASPRLEERKPGHAEDYARRTSEAALRAHARAIDQARSRDEGRER